MPEDLVQLYPHGMSVTVRTTEDDSTTRLLLTMRESSWQMGSPWLTTELHVAHVQQLARGLMQWLAVGGHDVPYLLPDLELDDDGEDDMPDRFGTLTVTEARDGVVIEQADPWVMVSRALWDHWATAGGHHVTVNGDLLTIRDSRGVVVSYWRRAVGPERGTWALQRTGMHPGLPQHSRPRRDAPDVAAGLAPEQTRAAAD